MTPNKINNNNKNMTKFKRLKNWRGWNQKHFKFHKLFKIKNSNKKNKDQMWRKTKLKGLVWNFEEVGARFKEREEEERNVHRCQTSGVFGTRFFSSCRGRWDLSNAALQIVKKPRTCFLNGARVVYSLMCVTQVPTCFFNNI
jgi:hypothetical protein